MRRWQTLLIDFFPVSPPNPTFRWVCPISSHFVFSSNLRPLQCVELASASFAATYDLSLGEYFQNRSICNYSIMFLKIAEWTCPTFRDLL